MYNRLTALEVETWNASGVMPEPETEDRSDDTTGEKPDPRYVRCTAYRWSG